jgi:hypothetical protein
VCAYADINYIGLNYAVAGFDNHFTGWICDYGKHPEGKSVLWDPDRSSKSTEAQTISAGIIQFVDLIVKHKTYIRSGERVVPIIFIDANFMTETVCNTITAVRKNYPGLVIYPDRGRGVKSYLPAKKDKIIGGPGNNFHVEKGNYGTQIVHNADYWRMATQKAFSLSPGIPGSISIWGDNDKIHEEFSEEICAERLLEFMPGDRRDFYDWYLVPGYRNDKLDAVVGCCVGAAFSGATLTGGERPWRKSKKRKSVRRKPKVSIIN